MLIDGSTGLPGPVTPYDQIAADFHRRIECIASAVDHLAAPLEQAAELLAAAALEDRKILVCACGCDEGLGQYIARLLRTGDSGPSLPALAFGDPGLPDDDADFWRDLRTLSRDGDVLLSLDTQINAPLATRCAEFASLRNLLAISLSDASTATDGLSIPLMANGDGLRTELALMVAHSLRDRVWQRLLGE